ncbi:MAG: tetratricopeptide repeat protein [Desulfobacteraceae bacterium]|uniref:Tetratricopeptide repeat protein n=1 Tax=Candidatus Desulfacyla euxinica TaxID=2841693 RepID=A0A8J6N2L8_9DELT|nr:tetratricopeptide repeat protein [Candidatus Desulfacyla euxinica]MBL6977622.1 tetratricopeptide repeat protein [Desulfobacteraceae bacterium]MBL7216209.1 tetratricopeptide repeat protein [Desulfobacteraceae bacterium]
MDSSTIPLNLQVRRDAGRFRGLIRERTGLFSSNNWYDNLVRDVAAAAESAGYENITKYYGILQKTNTESEVWDNLVSAITVGETYFFRNPNHFAALRHSILPELIAQRRDVRRLRIWSAGCATGEEAYSLAILLHELIPDIGRWNIFILGTDINKKVLRGARKGSYGEWSFRQTEPATRTRYFVRRGNRFQLDPSVRKMVTYGYLNLADDVYPSLPTNTNAMDLILCRNVTIYLPETMVREMAERFYSCLVPEGWLIMGAAETSEEIYTRFEVKNLSGAFVYQRPSGFARPVETRGKPDAETLPDTSHISVASPPHGTSAPPPKPPSPKPFDLYEDGLALIQEGRLDEAIACFKKHLENNPDSGPTYIQIARLHADAGRLKDARRYGEEAIKRDPLSPEAYYTLGLIHQESNEPDEAITQIKKTLYLDSSLIVGHFSLANLYRQMGREKDAARNRAQAIRLAAKMPPDQELAGAGGLTAGRLLAMVKATM